MRIRESFLIRWLKTFDSKKNEISIIDIEHIQSGDQWRASSIEDATEILKKAINRDTTGEKDINTNS